MAAFSQLQRFQFRDIRAKARSDGDGDYLPAIEEAIRQGIRVFTGAFSDGLDERLRIHGDEFIDLDIIYFESENANITASQS